MSGSDLKICSYVGSSAELTILNQTTSETKIERLELDNNKYLTDSDVNTIIQQMSAYASSNSISFTSLSNVKASADLVNIIATA